MKVRKLQRQTVTVHPGAHDREMRRALVTAFGNARSANCYRIEAADLPKAGRGKMKIGFLQ